jgi:solute carrier family 25 folate transporter 32
MIKLRLQNRNTARRAHDVFKAIWDKEGIRGLYRGVNPTIAGYLPTWMIYFTVYDSSKKYYTRHLSDKIVLSHILSALQAGLASTILTNPLWVARSNFSFIQLGS